MDLVERGIGRATGQRGGRLGGNFSVGSASNVAVTVGGAISGVMDTSPTVVGVGGAAVGAGIGVSVADGTNAVGTMVGRGVDVVCAVGVEVGIGVGRSPPGTCVGRGDAVG